MNSETVRVVRTGEEIELKKDPNTHPNKYERGNSTLSDLKLKDLQLLFLTLSGWRFRTGTLYSKFDATKPP